jgi:hypothetical protein
MHKFNHLGYVAEAPVVIKCMSDEVAVLKKAQYIGELEVRNLLRLITKLHHTPELRIYMERLAIAVSKDMLC